jgi:predicted HTH transcriptional regulator
MTPEEIAKKDLAGGEGRHVEFKEFVRLKDPKEAELERTLVAFANSGGGRLYIGVSDDHTCQGIVAAKEAAKEPNDGERALEILARRLDTEIASWVRPERPPMEIKKLELDGRPFLAVHVAEGRTLLSTRDDFVFVRKDASTVRATIEEIRDLLRDEGGRPAVNWSVL